MTKIIILLTFSVLFASCGQTNGTKQESTGNFKSEPVTNNVAESLEQDAPPGIHGVFKHVYEYNTADLIEDVYIILDSTNNYANSRFYGTTDEFDVAREGYLPAFAVCSINNLFLTKDSISFSIDFMENEIFRNPVDLSIKNSSQISDSQNPKTELWNFDKQTVQLSGRFSKDSLYIYSSNFDPRLFLRIE